MPESHAAAPSGPADRLLTPFLGVTMDRIVLGMPPCSIDGRLFTGKLKPCMQRSGEPWKEPSDERSSWSSSP